MHFEREVSFGASLLNGNLHNLLMIMVMTYSV